MSEEIILDDSEGYKNSFDDFKVKVDTGFTIKANVGNGFTYLPREA